MIIIALVNYIAHDRQRCEKVPETGNHGYTTQIKNPLPQNDPLWKTDGI